MNGWFLVCQPTIKKKSFYLLLLSDWLTDLTQPIARCFWSKNQTWQCIGVSSMGCALAQWREKLYCELAGVGNLHFYSQQAHISIEAVNHNMIFLCFIWLEQVAVDSRPCIGRPPFTVRLLSLIFWVFYSTHFLVTSSFHLPISSSSTGNLRRYTTKGTSPLA